MWRRKVIAAGAALLVSPPPSRAQETRRRLGVLYIGPLGENALRDGLRNRGWIEGRNLVVEYRQAQSQDQLPALAAELVALNPDVLISVSPPAALALRSATTTIPIVFVGVADPVSIGLVQSLARPGGNVTGLATLVPGVPTKALETLREIVPAASKIAVLANPGNPIHWLARDDLTRAAQQLGVALPILEATTAEELDAAFASAASQRADGICVLADPLTFRYAPRVTALAARHRLPASYLSRIFVTEGGLISYGPDFFDLYFRVGGYVDKILKGAKPSDLPVEQPTKFELAINTKTARELGLTVPRTLFARASEVIE